MINRGLIVRAKKLAHVAFELIARLPCDNRAIEHKLIYMRLGEAQFL